MASDRARGKDARHMNTIGVHCLKSTTTCDFLNVYIKREWKCPQQMKNG